MDFSEIIVAIIIGLVILAINSVGSKKQQSSKNQPGRQPGRTIFPEASTQAPQREEQEESRDASTPLTLDEIFAELRRAHEEEERKAHEADEYIPRAPRRAQPQPLAALRCSPWSEENLKPNGDHSLDLQNSRLRPSQNPNRQQRYWHPRRRENRRSPVRKHLPDP